jgi:hypothetical protein
VRQIDLGLDFIGVAPGARGAGGRGLGRRVKVSPYLFGLVVLKRTGMGLFLGDSDFRKDIENSLAFDFQFPRQIVDSNLTHPPFLAPPRLPKSS